MIDCHAHVFSAGAPATAGARYRPAYAACLQAWQALWPASGITRGVLVQPSFFGTDNSELVAALAEDRRRLRGVAVVDAGISDSELDRLASAGVRALRWNLKGIPDYGAFATPAWGPLLERVHARGWHLEIHVDAGRLAEIAPALDGTAIALVFDHFGNPGPDARAVGETFRGMAALASNRAVWSKLSGPYRLEGADCGMLAKRWLETVGPTRLVWGSDWPHTNHEGKAVYTRLRQDLDRWVGRERSAAILWDNAARLYRFD